MRKADSPKPADVKALRASAGITQRQAASLVSVTLRGWQHWEDGTRRMRPSTWELARIKLTPYPTTKDIPE